MRNRTRILLALVVLAFLGVTFWHVFKPHEPVYNGKRLSEWLEQKRTARVKAATGGQPLENSTEWLEASNSLRHIGTNAIPSLLRMLEAKDSPFELRLIALAEKQKFIPVRYTWSGFTSPLFHYVTADMLHDRAEDGFEFMGADASNAVPDLIRIYKEKLSQPGDTNPLPLLRAIFNDPILIPAGGGMAPTAYGKSDIVKYATFNQQNPSLRVVYAIGDVGPAAKSAVPLLIEAMTNSDDRVKFPLLVALGRIHAEPLRVVPIMVSTLTNTACDINLRVVAAGMIGKFGPDAKPWSPALFAAFHEIQQDDDAIPNRREWAHLLTILKDTLEDIDPESAAKLFDGKSAEII